MMKPLVAALVVTLAIVAIVVLGHRSEVPPEQSYGVPAAQAARVQRIKEVTARVRATHSIDAQDMEWCLEIVNPSAASSPLEKTIVFELFGDADPSSSKQAEEMFDAAKPYLSAAQCKSPATIPVVAAINAAVRQGGDLAIPYLVPLSQSSNDTIRRRAAQGLRRLGGTVSIGTTSSGFGGGGLPGHRQCAC